MPIKLARITNNKNGKCISSLIYEFKETLSIWEYLKLSLILQALLNSSQSCFIINVSWSVDFTQPFFPLSLFWFLICLTFAWIAARRTATGTGPRRWHFSKSSQVSELCAPCACREMHKRRLDSNYTLKCIINLLHALLNKLQRCLILRSLSRRMCRRGGGCGEGCKTNDVCDKPLEALSSLAKSQTIVI